MSDKIREIIEVPQQFVRDGNHVCYNYLLHLCLLMKRLHFAVPHTLHKANRKRSAHACGIAE